jgi:cell division septation protein DedD
MKNLSKRFVILLVVSSSIVLFNAYNALCGVTENKSVREPSRSKNPLKGIFIIQAGTFSDFSHAKSLRKRLDDRGFNAYIILSESKNGQNLYKVCMGKFINKEDADTLSKKINNRENMQTFVTLELLKGIFVVQAGAFSDFSNAKTLRKRLAERGYNAYIILSGQNGQKLYKVCVGEFIDRDQAEKLSEEINKKENMQTFVTLR